jgi:hypothetical protein
VKPVTPSGTDDAWTSPRTERSAERSQPPFSEMRLSAMTYACACSGVRLTPTTIGTFQTTAFPFFSTKMPLGGSPPFSRRRRSASTRPCPATSFPVASSTTAGATKPNCSNDASMASRSCVFGLKSA